SHELRSRQYLAGERQLMDPQDLTQPFATRRPIPPPAIPAIPSSPSRSAFLNQPPNPIIPTTGAARFWYVDPRATRGPNESVSANPLSGFGVDAMQRLPEGTPFAFSKGGRSKDNIPAMLSKGEVVLNKAQQKKIGLKRIRDVIGDKHG